MKQLILCLSFLALLPGILSFYSTEVPENTRQNFSLNFFRREHTDSLTDDYVVSPAAVQKFLVVLYDGSAMDSRKEILDDLCVRFTESYKLLDMAIAYAQQVTREEPHRLYFKNDFNDLKENCTIKNYIVGKHEFDDGFKFVSRNYFDVKTINRLEEKDLYATVKQEFPEALNDEYNLQIVSSIDFEANLQQSFKLVDGRLHGVGEFRYGTYENLHIIELPLQSNEELTLQIFMAKTLKSFIDFIRKLGKEFNHMNMYEDKLDLKTVSVTLPAFEIENFTDLTNYFKVYGIGAKRMFTENFGMEAAFGDSRNGVKIDSFWQKTKVHIKPFTENDEAKNSGKVNEANAKDIDNEAEPEIFDATDNSFLYFIKSKDILYFIGTHYVPEKV